MLADVLVRTRAISVATETLRGAETHRQFGTLHDAQQRLAVHIDSASAAYYLPVLSRSCVGCCPSTPDRAVGSRFISIRALRD